MAFTMTTVVNTVFGNERVWSGYMTATNITGVAVIPGAQFVDAILGFFPITTAACAAGQVPVPTINLNASGAASAGAVGFSNVVSSTGAKYWLSVLYH